MLIITYFFNLTCSHPSPPSQWAAAGGCSGSHYSSRSDLSSGPKRWWWGWQEIILNICSCILSKQYIKYSTLKSRDCFKNLGFFVKQAYLIWISKAFSVVLPSPRGYWNCLVPSQIGSLWLPLPIAELLHYITFIFAWGSNLLVCRNRLASAAPSSRPHLAINNRVTQKNKKFSLNFGISLKPQVFIG